MKARHEEDRMQWDDSELPEPKGVVFSQTDLVRTVLPREAEQDRMRFIADFRAGLDAILTDPAFEDFTLALVVSKNLQHQGVSNRDRVRALLIEPKLEMALEVLDRFSGRLRYKTAIKLLRRFGVEEDLDRPRDVSLSLAATRDVLDRLAFYIKRDHSVYKRAQRDLFENHFGLAIEIAKHMAGGNGHFDDAVQEGAFGLLQAVDKCEPREDSSFSAYASYWIRKCIIDYQGGHRYSVYVPISFIRLVRKVHNRFDEHQQAEAAPCDPDLFAARQGLTPEALQAFVTLRHGSVSLDDPLGDGDETRSEIVADSSAITPDILAARKDAREYLQRALNYLTPQQRAVIMLRYGLGEDGEEHSQSEVAAKIGLCFQRVSRLEASALTRFRKLVPRAVLREALAALA